MTQLTSYKHSDLGHLFRYVRNGDSQWGTNIRCQMLPILSLTQKGYWISDSEYPYNGVPKRWVSNSGRKRYAYPTEAEALFAFKARTQRAIIILKSNLQQAQNYLSAIEKKENEINEKQLSI